MELNPVQIMTEHAWKYVFKQLAVLERGLH